MDDLSPTRRALTVAEDVTDGIESAYDRIRTSDALEPYAIYDMIRRTAPIHFDGTRGTWLVSRYEDCQSLLRNSAFGKAALINPDRQSALESVTSQAMLMQDPPGHAKIRKIITPELSPAKVALRRDRIKVHVSALLEHLPEGRAIDAVRELALPYTLSVIGEILGIGPEDHEMFRHHADVITRRGTAGSGRPEPSRVDFDAGWASLNFVKAHLEGLVEERRRSPQDDLLSSLIAAADAGRISPNALVAAVIVSFIGGFETTTALVCNGLYTLLQHPQQLELVRDQPQLMAAAVDEMLRWEVPAPLAAHRIAARDADIASVKVAAGEQAVALLASANQDPEVYEHPAVFDVTRQGPPHMAFSAGMHFCPGASLARLEAEVLIGEVVSGFDYKLAVEPCILRKRCFPIRTFEQLPLLFERRR